MTSTATPTSSTVRAEKTLRRVLLADGIVGAITAAGLLLLTAQYQTTTGLSAELLRGAAIVLFGYVVALAWAGLRHPLPLKLVAGIVVANVAWIVASFVVLFTSSPSPSPFGVIYIVGQAVVVAGFALAEQRTLRTVRNYQR